MKWLINYLRECFCKHEWELLEEEIICDGEHIDKDIVLGNRWTYRCKKCGQFRVNKNYRM